MNPSEWFIIYSDLKDSYLWWKFLVKKLPQSWNKPAFFLGTTFPCIIISIDFHPKVHLDFTFTDRRIKKKSNFRTFEKDSTHPKFPYSCYQGNCPMNLPVIEQKLIWWNPFSRQWTEPPTISTEYTKENDVITIYLLS